jgi:hypothetical protein
MEEQSRDATRQDEEKPADERIEDLQPERDESGDVKGGTQTSQDMPSENVSIN